VALGQAAAILAQVPATAMVGFVDHQQGRRRYVLQALRHGLYHADLHEVVGHGVARLDPATRDTHRIQCGADLVRNLLAMCQDDDTVALRRGVLGDVGEANRFPAARGQDEQHASEPSEGYPGRYDAFGLIRSQDLRHGRRPCWDAVRLKLRPVWHTPSLPLTILNQHSPAPRGCGAVLFGRCFSVSATSTERRGRQARHELAEAVHQYDCGGTALHRMQLAGCQQAINGVATFADQPAGLERFHSERRQSAAACQASAILMCHCHCWFPLMVPRRSWRAGET
jgi:hypothetical protein